MIHKKIKALTCVIITGCATTHDGNPQPRVVVSNRGISEVRDKIIVSVNSGDTSEADFQYPVLISGVPREFAEMDGYVMTISSPEETIYCKFQSSVPIPRDHLYSLFRGAHINIKALVIYKNLDSEQPDET